MITGMAAGILLATALEGIWQKAPATHFAGYYTGTAWANGGQWEYNDAGNLWYYLDEKGEKAKGKKELNGDIYFFGEDGAMLTGMQEIGGKVYYLNEERRLGAPKGACVITDGSGAMVCGKNFQTGTILP